MRAPQLARELAGDTLLLERQALHAHRLNIEHPVSGKSMEFCATLPDDMQGVLEILRQ